MKVAERRDQVSSARLVAVAVLTAELAILAVTGLWLVFFYRPTGSSVGTAFTPGHRAGWVGLLRGVHRVTAFLSVPTAVLTAVLVIVDATTRRQSWRRARLAIVAAPALV